MKWEPSYIVSFKISNFLYKEKSIESVASEDIEGSPLSNFVELLASISKSAETISTLCVVNIPAT